MARECKKMTGGDGSKFNWKNCPYLLFGNSQQDRKNRCGHRKFAVWLGFVVILLIGCLGSMLAITVAAQAQKPAKTFKTKRFIEFDENDSIGGKAELLSQSDIRLVPEREFPRELSNRRVGKHPNHRYAEMESKNKIYRKMMKDLYAESGWSPRPFGRTGNNIGETILGEKGEGRGKVKGLKSPMRLKGFYIQPHDSVEDQDKEFSDNYYYLREINELMRNDSREREKEKKWLIEKDFKSHGLPFRLLAQEFEPLKKYEMSRSKKKHWVKRGWKKNQKKPMTILLEIYPMTDPRAPNHRKSFLRQFSKANYIPRDPGVDPMMASSTANLQTFDSSRKNNKMLMKLTLHPKKRKEEEEEDIREFPPLDEDDKRAERKTFSLFSKKKKKKHETKKCFVIGLYPYGKPTASTAKWKDEHGDWVHAKYVTFKHFDDDDDYYDDHHWH